MASKSPPQKKRESYEKDRRNTYGENSKSSRKNIARKKRRRAREERRKVRAVVAVTSDDETIELAVDTVASLRKQARPVKHPDTPLGVVVARKLARRADQDEP